MGKGGGGMSLPPPQVGEGQIIGGIRQGGRHHTTILPSFLPGVGGGIGHLPSTFLCSKAPVRG